MSLSQQVITLLGELDELLVTPIGIVGDTLLVEVEGRRYGYQIDSAKFQGTIEDLARKFQKMMPYSVGRALAWLKANSKVVSGSVKGIPRVIRDTPAEFDYDKTGSDS